MATKIQLSPLHKGEHQKPPSLALIVDGTTIIIPIKDEEDGLRLLEREFRQSHLSKRGDVSLITVVDCRSSDKSRELSEEFADIVIDQCESFGKGDAIKAAISRWSKHPTEFLIMMDGDGSYQWEDVANVIKKLEFGAEAVTGTRLRGIFVKVEGMSLLHHVGNHMLSLAASIRNRKRIRDLCSGLWGFNKDAITRISPTAQGFDLEAELHGRVRSEGIKLTQMPIDWRSRVGGVSKLRSFMDGLRILMRIIRT
jgi:hypothetical protein